MLIKHYKLRIKGNIRLETKYKDRVALFLENTNHPILRLHKLKGKFQGLLSFSITGDLRVVFQEFDEYYFFYDIGSHNQVYV